MKASPTIGYLFTTFPALTETFNQREARALRELAVQIRVYSLWGGEREFDGAKVILFPKWKIITLAWWLPFWIARRPAVIGRTVRALSRRAPPSWLNLGETLLGLAFALIHAWPIARSTHCPDLLHAAWATMPATAAQLIHRLTGMPYTMGAHAFDIFEDGGDWFLAEKLHEAAMILTSTQMARASLCERGAPPERVRVVRRGLECIPTLCPPRAIRTPLRLLSIGRLIEKKGFSDQLVIYAFLKSRGFEFEARIIGAGPERTALATQIREVGLEGVVALLGAISGDELDRHRAWADAFIFTGRIAASGDRDGLPNVVPEAMASGLPVVATPADGICEAIEDGRSGILLDRLDLLGWLNALERLRDESHHYESISRAGWRWVKDNFDVRRNAPEALAIFTEVLDPIENARPSRPSRRSGRSGKLGGEP